MTTQKRKEELRKEASSFFHNLNTRRLPNNWIGKVRKEIYVANNRELDFVLVSILNLRELHRGGDQILAEPDPAYKLTGWESDSYKA